jgi:hypothetical protein
MTNYIRIWKYPALLAVLTLFGLISALVGTGPWHFASWITLIIPLAVGIRYSLITRAPKK